MFGRIDHIGVAVSSIEDSIGLYRDAFGMAEQHRETVEEQGVKAGTFAEPGDTHQMVEVKSVTVLCVDPPPAGLVGSTKMMEIV